MILVFLLQFLRGNFLLHQNPGFERNLKPSEKHSTQQTLIEKIDQPLHCCKHRLGLSDLRRSRRYYLLIPPADEPDENIFTISTNSNTIFYNIEIEHSILSNDLALHFSNLARPNQLVDTGDIDWSNTASIKILTAALMTASDLRASTKPWNYQQKTPEASSSTTADEPSDLLNYNCVVLYS